MTAFEPNVETSGNLFDEATFASINNIVDANLRILRTYDLDMYDLKYKYYS